MGFFSKTKKEEKNTVESVEPWVAFALGMMTVASFRNTTDATAKFLAGFQYKNNDTERAFNEAFSILDKNNAIKKMVEIIVASLTEEQILTLHANMVEFVLIETTASEFLRFLQDENFKNNSDDILADQIGFLSLIINHKFGSNNATVEEITSNIMLTIANKNDLSIFDN